jgi:Na+/H+-dicarboxylate symporter
MEGDFFLMKEVWKNYKKTIILILALIVGAIVGVVLGDKTKVLAPFGDVFINLLLVIIVPLIFLTITTSIAKIKQPKRLGKVLVTIFISFIVTSLISVLIGLGTTNTFKLIDPSDTDVIKENLSEEEAAVEEENDFVSYANRTVSTLTVGDFSGVLTRNNIVAIIVFAILIGLAINKVGIEAEPFLNVLEAANKVVLKFIDIIFLYAPIGLGCYFAALVGTFGSEIAVGFGKTFIIYTVVAVLFYFIIYSLYAFIAGGKKGFIAFWKNIMPATATSLSTCSSAASIPVNMDCAKKIGVSNDIAETMIPLGTSFHKDGSVIGSVFKIMFLVYLFGTNPSIWTVIGVSLLATLLVTAVPVGGGTISETLILTMMGFPLTALPILTIIATIIDPPATLLNVVGDTSSSMLVARIVDGKNWMNKDIKSKKKVAK